jgi:hypothetical protein
MPRSGSLVVGGVVYAAEAEIGMAVGFLVAVENDFFGATFARDAEVARLLAAFLEGRAIGDRGRPSSVPRSRLP